MNALPEQGTALARFAQELRTLRETAGTPSLTAMARHTGVSAASLSGAHQGTRMPTWRVVHAYVSACYDDPAKWRARWETLRAQACLPDETAAGLRAALADGRPLPSAAITTAGQLAETLDLVRRTRGLSLRAIAQHTRYYSHHTYGQALRGARPLTVHLVIGVLSACGITSPQTVMHWLTRLAEVQPDQTLTVHRYRAELEERARRVRRPVPVRGQPRRPGRPLARAA